MLSPIGNRVEFPFAYVRSFQGMMNRIDLKVKILQANSIIIGFLGGGFKGFLFSPLLGLMIQCDKHIFQMI